MLPSSSTGIVGLMEVRVGPSLAFVLLPDSSMTDGPFLLSALESALNQLPTLSIFDRLMICRDLISALAFLHSGADEGAFSIIHNHVHAGNVVLCASRSARLIDFSGSRVDLTTTEDQLKQALHAAAASASGSLAPVKRSGPKQDLYQFGQLLQELFDRVPVTVPPCADPVHQQAVIATALEIKEAAHRLSGACMDDDWDLRPDTTTIFEILEEFAITCRALGIVAMPASTNDSTILPSELAGPTPEEGIQFSLAVDPRRGVNVER